MNRFARLAAVLAVAGAVLGAGATAPALARPQVAHVAHVPPPIGSYKIAWTDGTGGTLKDNGSGNSYIITGNPMFSSNFSRTNCGNRGNPAVYYCQYIDGNDLAPTESGGVVKAGNPVAASTQLWSDPGTSTSPSTVWSWYDYNRGVFNLLWKNQASSLIMSTSASFWSLNPQ